MKRDAVRRKLAAVLRRLEGELGRPMPEPRGKIVDELVATILSQNTTSANARVGYARLTEAFDCWAAAADAPVGRIERCIRPCGLSRIKAPRIRRILRQIRSDCGRISLEFLRRRKGQEVMAYLRSFDGVGPKTALCVMLFAMGRCVFPVDTHIDRMARRLGVLDRATPTDRAHEVLEPLIASQDRYAMHVLLIAHGRHICRARNPRCGACCLLDLCPTGQERLRRPRRRARGKA